MVAVLLFNKDRSLDNVMSHDVNHNESTGMRPLRHRLSICVLMLSTLLSGAVLGDAGHSHAPSADDERLNADLLNWDELDQNALETSLGAPEPLSFEAVAPQNLGVAAQFGQWSDVDDWPIVAIHANLLPNGKVLSWDATPDDSDDDPHTTDNFTTRVTLWDPVTNTHQSTNNDTDSDLFCAGSAHLWDGRILFAGGDSGTARANGPLENTNIYDPETNTWRRVTNMATPRWYSSVAALPNGEMLTYAGFYEPDPVAEVFQFNETWRTLSFTTPFDFGEDYQWMQATPDGDVITFGPQNIIATIETGGEGQWITGPQRDDVTSRTYGSYAMYDIGKVLVSGGGDSEASAVVIDTATQQTTTTGAMNIGRRQHNLTILADGSVLATGGNSDGSRLVSTTAAVYSPEIWNPATGQWRLMNDMQGNRQYHSVALLLADGRVLSAGGGICGDCYAVGYEEQTAEIYSPPYLFSSGNTLATRPVISAVPDEVDYGYAFTVSTEQSTTIDRVHLIKLGAATHSQNQDQRLVPLSFDRYGDRLSVRMPDSRNDAPPGHYLLFIIDNQGVPSVGSIIKVGQPLMTPEDSVSNSVRAGQRSIYAIESSDADSAITVQMRTVNAAATLELYADSPIATDSQPACSVTGLTGSLVQCELPNRDARVWYAVVNGIEETRFVMTSAFTRNANADGNYPLAVNSSLNDRVAAGEWNYYVINTTASQTALTLSLENLSDDVDLYVLKGQRPSASSNQCASYRLSNETEQCTLTSSVENSEWTVGVFGYRAGSYDIRVSEGVVTPAATVLTPGVATNVSVPAGEWRYFQVPESRGPESTATTRFVAELSGLTADADLYIRQGQLPSGTVAQAGDYDCGSFGLATVAESCVVQQGGASGDWFVGVYSALGSSGQVSARFSSSAALTDSPAQRLDKAQLVALRTTVTDGSLGTNGSSYGDTGENTVTVQRNVRTGGSLSWAWLLLGLPVVLRRWVYRRR